MGGTGSGRTDYATTSTVEASRTLDVNGFTDAVAHPGHTGTVRWGSEEDPSATIGFALLPESGDADRVTGLRLSYTTTPTGGESTDHEYTVPLEYTACNFGGSRPWFRCPGVVNDVPCGRRVAKLHCPPGAELYLCRECYDLGYQSSRISRDAVETARLRYQRAHEKIDGRRPHPNGLTSGYPDRPKGMHRETYERLMDDLEDARREWDDAFHRKLSWFQARQ